MTDIPKRITPDFLKDSIIEFRFEYNIDIQLIPGLISKDLEKVGFSFIPSPKPQNTVGLKIETAIEPTFTNGQVTCRFTPQGTIVFNCLEGYIGWEAYSEDIKSLVEIFIQNHALRRLNRVGLRYINLFEETNVFDITDGGLRITIPNGKTELTNIKTELIEDHCRIILNMGNSFHINNEGSQKRVSIIDIDVMSEPTVNKEIDINQVIQEIERVHNKEKELFFTRILTKEFRNTLKMEG